MLHPLLKFLQQPYPYYYRGKSLLVILGVLFIASTLFNYLFEPFGNNPDEMRFSFFIICVLHSLNAGLTILLVAGINSFFVQEDKWNIGRELFLWGIFLFAIGVAQFFLRDLVYDNAENWSNRYFLEEIRNTYLIGGILFLMLISFNFNRLYFHNRIQAQSMKINPKEKSGIEEMIRIETEVQQDNFELDPNELIYAHSEKNYLSIYLEKNNLNNQKLIRLPIKRFEQQLNGRAGLLRVHRSYLVNLRRIVAIHGNASGYQLSLDGTEVKVPVSRSYIASFEHQMELLK